MRGEEGLMGNSLEVSQSPFLRKVLRDHALITHAGWTWWRLLASIFISAGVIFCKLVVDLPAATWLVVLVIPAVLCAWPLVDHSYWNLKRHLKDLRACKERGLIDDKTWQSMSGQAARCVLEFKGLM